MPRWDDFQGTNVISNFADMSLLVEKTDILVISHTYYRSLRGENPRSHARENPTL